MAVTGKFVYSPLQKPAVIQPECPVYVYGYGLAKQKYGEAVFAQVRLVNRTEKVVHGVFLRIDGLDSAGNVLYELEYIPLVDCKGQGFKDFGEEQPLFLPQGNVATLNIQVLDVLFEDGMIWRKQNGQRLMTAEDAGWVTCSCGMKNPGASKCCVFCGKAMVETIEEVPEPVVAEIAEPEEVTEEPVEEPKAEEEVLSVVPAMEVPEEQVEATEEEAEPAPEETEETPAEQEPSSEEEISTTEEPATLEEAAATEESSADEEMTLAELLAPIWEKVEQIERGLEQEETEDSTIEDAEADTAEETPEPERMQETKMLLNQIQERMLALERGEEIPVQKAEESAEEGTETDTAQQRKDRSRGILFWVLMVLLLILLGGATFLAVLYWKGYFG